MKTKVDNWLIDVIRCPICENKLLIYEHKLICSTCKSKYKIKKNIPVLLPINTREKWAINAHQIAKVLDLNYQKRIKQCNGWWIRDSPNKYLNLSREYNFACGRWEIVDFVGKGYASSTIIDIGGGEGFVSDFLQKKYKNKRFKLIEVDLSNVIQQNGAKRYKPEKREIYYLTSDALHIGLQNNIADVVISTECIEHIRDSYLFANQVNKILKKGGRFLITTPNKQGFAFWFGERRRLYILKIGRGKDLGIKQGDEFKNNKEDYEKILFPSDIERLLKDNGFLIEEHIYNQFLGTIFFSFCKKLLIPLGICRLWIKISQFFEILLNIFFPFGAKIIGFNQLIIARKK